MNVRITCVNDSLSLAVGTAAKLLEILLYYHRLHSPFQQSTPLTTRPRSLHTQMSPLISHLFLSLVLRVTSRMALMSLPQMTSSKTYAQMRLRPLHQFILSLCFCATSSIFSMAQRILHHPLKDSVK